VIEESRRRIAAVGERALVVLDVPLLYESRMEGMMDRVVVVAINERERFRRLRRRGFHEREIIARLGMQMPQARKTSLADYVIDNSGTIEATRKQVETMLEQIFREKS
jgi:dephospho-CoA kinase